MRQCSTSQCKLSCNPNLRGRQRPTKPMERKLPNSKLNCKRNMIETALKTRTSLTNHPCPCPHPRPCPPVRWNSNQRTSPRVIIIPQSRIMQSLSNTMSATYPSGVIMMQPLLRSSTKPSSIQNMHHPSSIIMIRGSQRTPRPAVMLFWKF